MCRILKHPFYHTSDFEQKVQQCNRFSRESRFEKSIFLGQFALKNFFYFLFNLHLKIVLIGAFPISWTACSWERCFCNKNILWIEKFEKNQISNQLFHNATEFETKKLLRVKVWIEFPHCVRTWIKIFTTHQISIKKLFLEKSNFVVKLAFKDSFSWSINTVKTSMLAFFVHSWKGCSGKSCF